MRCQGLKAAQKQYGGGCGIYIKSQQKYNRNASERQTEIQNKYNRNTSEIQTDIHQNTDNYNRNAKINTAEYNTIEIEIEIQQEYNRDTTDIQTEIQQQYSRNIT